MTKQTCSSTWTRGCSQRGVVERRDVPEPHHADVERRRRTRGGRAAPAPRSSRSDAAASTGRRMHLASARAMQQDRREVEQQHVLDHVHARTSCSPSASIGETSATSEHSRPPSQAARRQPPAPRGPPRGAHAPPARDVDATRAPGDERSARGEGPRGVGGGGTRAVWHSRAAVAARRACDRRSGRDAACIRARRRRGWRACSPRSSPPRPARLRRLPRAAARAATRCAALPARAAVAAAAPLPALRAAAARAARAARRARRRSTRLGAAGLRRARRARSSRALKFRGALPRRAT